jgi:sialate O-acetylesterase
MKKLKRIFFFALLAIGCNILHAQIKLPQLVRDSMILQRDTKIKIWGWAKPSEKVAVKFLNKTYKTKAGADGKWLTELAPAKAGGPYTMELTASNKIVLKDILLGDVWFCNGQSNMVHQVGIHDVAYANEIATANNPQIRHVFIPTLNNMNGPADDLPPVYWKSTNPVDIRQFSAVAYFFAKNIYEKYKVPIGLINASVGGTPIEAWISEDGFKDFPTQMATIVKNKDTAYINGLRRRAFTGGAPLTPRQQTDKGTIGKWYDVNYKPKGWSNINIPGYWEDQGLANLDGVLWYRKELDIPQNLAGKAARVHLGRIVDADELYINGQRIGGTTYMYPQRRYAVAEGVLKPGKNLFVVRVTNNAGKGGFVPDKPYYIEIANQQIDLKGTWQYKVGDVVMPRALGFGPTDRFVQPVNAQNQPTALFNAMTAPATNFAIKGALWYQGESNTGNAVEYAKLLPALIADTRKQFNSPNATYIVAQLPNYMDFNYVPQESNWAVLRESQMKATDIPNTAVTVNIDLGEWNDIHPDNKKDVGERMALAARKLAYGENIVYSGPTYKEHKIDGNKVTITFANTGSGIVSIDDEELRWFAVAGADKRFVWAQAKIEGNNVIVWSDAVANPVFVRYAWADNPPNVNFYNKEGLPASPFRIGN